MNKVENQKSEAVGKFQPRKTDTGDWLVDVLNARSNAQDHRRPGLVYFVSYGEEGPIKIGFSSRFEDRLAGLQTCCPHELKVIATVDAGMGLEKELQKKFSEHRLHGEWFTPHPDILAEIARLNATDTKEECE